MASEEVEATKFLSRAASSLPPPHVIRDLLSLGFANGHDQDLRTCKGNSVSVTMMAISEMLKKEAHQIDGFSIEISLPPRYLCVMTVYLVYNFCKLTISCYRLPVYIGGRYLKLSRKVSQSCWMIEDERMGEASVEEIIGNNTIPGFCRGYGEKS
ncbi:hypothetical protein J5N97_022698 [Dioscorea zingiberensis]|uniref:tRNA pseudouridine(55) synthase n=1 Tax=Dioscorea zingiberensis TaxID=325984 RepID=A0A9D5CB20_9LILI|nr:hypothetical protein J5N97_022698 [Dioscorea zingiberensis]